MISIKRGWSFHLNNLDQASCSHAEGRCSSGCMQMQPFQFTWSRHGDGGSILWWQRWASLSNATPRLILLKSQRRVWRRGLFGGNVCASVSKCASFLSVQTRPLKSPHFQGDVLSWCRCFHCPKAALVTICSGADNSQTTGWMSVGKRQRGKRCRWSWWCGMMQGLMWMGDIFHHSYL